VNVVDRDPIELAMPEGLRERRPARFR